MDGEVLMCCMVLVSCSAVSGGLAFVASTQAWLDLSFLSFLPFFSIGAPGMPGPGRPLPLPVLQKGVAAITKHMYSYVIL